MATRTERLALEVVSDVDGATKGLGLVESSAEAATREVSRLDSALEVSGAGVDKLSGAADGLDGAMGAATGAMGALGSGLELAGFEGAAENLQKAAMATDFLSGVGQAAALAVQAQGAATKALTVAQTAANAVMRANPIGLVVLAITALVAGLILAYNKSDEFRAIVDKAGQVAKAAFEAISSAVATVVDWVKDKVPPAFETMKDKAARALEGPREAVGKVIDVLKDVAEWVKDKVPAAFETMKDKAVSIAEAILAPFVAVRDAIQGILDKIASIKVPDLNPLNGRRAADTDPSSDADALFESRNGRGTTDPVAGNRTVIHVVINQTVGDPVAAAREIRAILARADRIV